MVDVQLWSLRENEGLSGDSNEGLPLDSEDAALSIPGSEKNIAEGFRVCVVA